MITWTVSLDAVKIVRCSDPKKVTMLDEQECCFPIMRMSADLEGLGLQVKSTRKGLTNQLKTLLWRKPLTGTAVSIQGRDSPLSGSVHGGSVHGGAANGGLTAYSGASIESQMRSLADLAFLMQVGQAHGLRHALVDHVLQSLADQVCRVPHTALLT